MLLTSWWRERRFVIQPYMIYVTFSILVAVCALSQRSHNDEVEDNVVEQLNDVKSNSASIALFATSQ